MRNFLLLEATPTAILFCVGEISVDSKQEDLLFWSSCFFERKSCRGKFGAQKFFRQVWRNSGNFPWNP